ncbi:hypothetical protein [Streptomyces triticiradicis]|uniref:hypothetical protein n=1 Tax=Streptomyces triticiradicis TaxID=2651189 RepID=UPI001788AB94|nr:hypothetical protein [Streptomyces triticiradicis]
MRITMINAARAVAVAVGTILATGCGTDLTPADRTAVTAPAHASSSAPVSFGQKAVRREMQAAVTAAGLTGGKVEAGFGRPQEPRSPVDTGKKRKAAALDTRLTPCVVTWVPTEQYRSPRAADSADRQRQLEAMLSSLAARGWKEGAPRQKAPVGGGGTYFMASYKKKGWLLYARHLTAPSLDQVTVMVTETPASTGSPTRSGPSSSTSAATGNVRPVATPGTPSRRTGRKPKYIQYEDFRPAHREHAPDAAP